jgi:hypothetical protein
MIISKYCESSKCAINDKEKLYLQELLGNKIAKATLRYRGSEHGWKAKDFHSRCDKIRPTISLFKVKDGDCIGGYTTAKWSSETDKGFKDTAAMLFNLSQERHFPL